MDKWRALVIVLLSVELSVLAGIIALGKVAKDSSYGLEIVLMALGGALAVVVTGKKD